MLGEATLDVSGTFLGEAIRLPIQIAALQGRVTSVYLFVAAGGLASALIEIALVLFIITLVITSGSSNNRPSST